MHLDSRTAVKLILRLNLVDFRTVPFAGLKPWTGNNLLIYKLGSEAHSKWSRFCVGEIHMFE